MSFTKYQRPGQGSRESSSRPADACSDSLQLCSYGAPGNRLLTGAICVNTSETAAAQSRTLPSDASPNSNSDGDSDASGEYEPLREPFTYAHHGCEAEESVPSTPPPPPPRPVLQPMRSASPQPQRPPLRPRSGSLETKHLRLLSWKRRSHHEAESALMPSNVGSGSGGAGSLREPSSHPERPTALPPHMQLERLLETAGPRQQVQRHRSSLLRRWTTRHRRAPSPPLNSSLPDLSQLGLPSVPASRTHTQASSPGRLSIPASLAVSPRRAASPSRRYVSPQALWQALRRLELNLFGKKTDLSSCSEELLIEKDERTVGPEHGLGGVAERTERGMLRQDLRTGSELGSMPLGSGSNEVTTLSQGQHIPEIVVTVCPPHREGATVSPAVDENGDDEDVSGYVRMESIQMMLHSPVTSRPASPSPPSGRSSADQSESSPYLDLLGVSGDGFGTSLSHDSIENEGDYLDMEGIQRLRTAMDPLA